VMNGRFVLISGSAGQSCPVDKLDVASQFVKGFTAEVLKRGGAVVVLAGDEGSIGEGRGTPHVFDWLALQEVERHANSTTERPRAYARVIMSDKARESKIDDAGLQLLKNLEQRSAVELCHIRREVFTGGEYRKAMVEGSDAMLAIGGGKGTYAVGTEMSALGKPVLPLDLQLGSTADDGDGAVALHREMASEPRRFFPSTHHDVMNRVGLLSLDRGINDAATVARVSAEMLSRELEASPLPEKRTNATRRLVAAWQLAKALPIVASAIKVIEWVKGLLPFI
jgi:hypothetical protein